MMTRIALLVALCAVIWQASALVGKQRLVLRTPSVLDRSGGSVSVPAEVYKSPSYSQVSGWRGGFRLFAKKKGGAKTLISDDLLSSFADDEETPATDSSPVALDTAKKDKKKKKGGGALISSSLLDELDDLEEKSEEVASIEASAQVEPPMADLKDGDEIFADFGGEKKKKKKKKKKKGGIDFSGLGLDEDGAKDTGAPDSDGEEKIDLSSFDLPGLEKEDDDESISSKSEDGPVRETAEQRMRKERGSSRIRFADSSQPDYTMIQLDGVGLVYGDNVILEDASYSVSTGDRVGLVGPNGSGKTTQLKILAGEMEPSFGDVVKSSRDMRIAYLKQEFTDELTLENTLRQELMSTFADEKKILDDIAAMEMELAEAAEDPTLMEEKLNKLSDLQEQANIRGVYSLESRIEKIMDQTGFGEADGDALVSSFSGGWKMRIGIAKILLQEPNVLLLDEPTNHLDLNSVVWLEGFLVKQTIPIIIVSHDREFLDQTCNRIVDVEEGKTISYKGNYSKFLNQRLERLNIWRDKYDKQTKFVREEEKAIKKMKSDPSMAQQMKNRAASLQKLKDSEEFVSQPPRDKRFRFRFPPAQRCSTNVVEAEGLMHGYGSGKHETLFRDVSFKVERGERIGFVGPNGSGKSTLLRLIMGTEDPKLGFTEYGGSNVFANYFAQNQADSFDLSKTVLQTVSEGAPADYSLTEVRTLLSQFMFKGDDVEKKLEVLSGGEKARVALCRMMLTPANLLLLDEPTNHLDITSKEVLEDALQYFEGSVMLVSHDRYFMSQAVNTIFEFGDKTMIRHDCDYLDYMLGRGGLKERVESRYVKGDSYRITAAPEVQIEKKEKSKKNFGGSGVTGGNLNKGIKNAKRFSNN